MNQEEMISALSESLSGVCEKMSGPVYYEGKGPYLIAMCSGKSNLHWFECFDVATAEAFLKAPEKIPEAFRNFDFLAETLEPMNIYKHKKVSPNNFTFIPRKLVPNTPLCRKKLQELPDSYRYLLDATLLIDHKGLIVRAGNYLDEPVRVN